MTSLLTTPLGRALELPRLRARVVPATLALMVMVTWVIRTTVAVAHTTPRIFPDEYIYAELGRSLGAGGGLEIRGTPAAFPALLEPILAAPLWRLAGDDVELGYRLVQSLHALAVALVAIPVYFIARRAGLSALGGIACAAFSLVLPAGLLSTYVMADAIAWPLALGAVAAGYAALDTRSTVAQLAFVGLAGAAAFARVQYVVLPLAFALVALALERVRLPRTVRAYPYAFGLFAAAGLATLALGPGRILGYYRGVTDLEVDPSAFTRWAGSDIALLGIAAGVPIVPGALVGAVAAVLRPAVARERMLGLLASTFAVLLLAEAALYASNGSGRFQERYLIALLPLTPVFFGLWARRVHERRLRLAAIAPAAAILVAAAAVPATTFTQFDGKLDSPTLQSVTWLERNAGLGWASLAVALVVSALALTSVVAVWRPRIGVPMAAVGAGLVLALASTASSAWSIDATERAQRTLLHGDARWIDAAGLDSVAILQTPFSDRAQVSAQLFWNTSLSEILQMRGASTVDAFGSTPTRIAPDGRILAGSRVFSTPLLVEEYGSFLILDDADLVRRVQSSALWTPRGTPRAAALVAGRYLDGWLGPRARVTVWPDDDVPRVGVLRMVLRLPKGAPASTIDITGPGLARTVTVAPGRPVRLELPLAHGRVWTASIRPRQPLLTDDGRLVSVLASRPAIVPAP